MSERSEALWVAIKSTGARTLRKVFRTRAAARLWVKQHGGRAICHVVRATWGPEQ